MAASPRPRFAELVFASRRLESPRRWVMAIFVAATAYLFLWSLVVLVARPSLASWATEVAMEVHARMDGQRQMNATLEVMPSAVPPPSQPPPSEPALPSEPPPPPSKPPQPAQAKGASIIQPAQQTPDPPQPEAPVQAAEVLALPADESATPDNETDNTIVNGQATEATGGIASGQGVAPSQASSGDVLGSASGAGISVLGAPPALRQPVRLADDDWACPWPAEADDAPIEEAEVVIRALVDAQGRLLRVQVDKDPGLGFAQAAKVCARGVRFTAALGPEGRPTQAWSPRIRVRFLR